MHIFNQSKKDSLDILSKELLQKILLELDPTTLARARRVNEFWKKAIDDLPWENLFKIYLQDINLPEGEKYTCKTFFEYYREEHKEFKNLTLWDAGKSNKLTLFKKQVSTTTLPELVEKKTNGMQITLHASDKGNKEFLNLIYWEVIKKRREEAHLDEIDFDEVGCALIHWAVICDQTEEIRRLVGTNSESINIPTKNDQSTPLLLAVAHQNSFAVKLLIELGANPMLRRSDDVTPLFLAAEWGFLEIVDHLLTVKVDLKTIFPEKVILDIYWVAPEVGLPDAIEEFVSLAHVLIPRNDGLTPPLIADAYNHEKIFEKLYAAAKKLQKINSWISGNFNNAEVMNFLNGITTNYYYLEFYLAVLKNDDEAFLSLINSTNGLNIDNSMGGVTALCMAVREGFLDMVQLLLTHRAEPNVLTADGNSPFSLALQEEHFDIAETLLRITSIEIIKTVNENGNAPLHFAAERGNISLVKSLLAMNLEINIANKEGCTPLHFAVAGGNPEIVDLLIEAGVCLNVQAVDGATALIDAVKIGKVKIVKLLVDNGADINIADNDGKTAISFVDESNNEELLEILTSSMRNSFTRS